MAQDTAHPFQPWQIIRPRAPLTRTRQRLKEKKLTIGFLGGSITDPRSRNNWPEPVVAWFVEQFPGLRVTVENAAIGATGSALAAFRARRDILARDCDLVFVEYAVNDNGEPTDERMRAREGLLRQLLANGERDVVIVYTFSQSMYADMLAHRVPPSIAEFEQLAEHYQLPSVWMGLHAFQEIQAGRMRWEEWLPDGLHPLERGSLSYAQSVIAYLHPCLEDTDLALPLSLSEAQQSSAVQALSDLPPLHPQCWEHVSLLPFDQVHTVGPWTTRRFTEHGWIDQTLTTAAIGAQLLFSCTARGLVLGFAFGRASAAFRYRLDDGLWQLVNPDRPAWMGDRGVFWVKILFEEEIEKPHQVVLEVLHGNAAGDRPDCIGTNFDLALIGLIHA